MINTVLLGWSYYERVPLYSLLLYQDLIQSKTIKQGDKLPPIFPVVLYNGEQRWNSATELSDLIIDLPGGLEQYKPSAKYLLLDEGCYTNDTLKPLKNLVAAIFRLENAQTPDEVGEVIDNLLDWLKSPEQAIIKRNFTLWIKRVLLSDNKEEDVLYEQANNLMELKVMLADRFSQWKENYKQEVFEQVLEQGIEKGELNKERSLLLRQIKLRFGGSFCHTIEPIIASIASTERLDQIADWIISCQDKHDFQTRVEQLSKT